MGIAIYGFLLMHIAQHFFFSSTSSMHTELVVITGCSSGLGRQTVKNLLATNKYHVVGAVRDVDKMEAVAEIEEFDMDNFHIMNCELNSFESVEKFCEELRNINWVNRSIA